MRKMVVVMVMACLIGGLMVQQSQAAMSWVLVDIKGAGPAQNNQINIKISNPANPAQYIYVYEPNTDADANRNLAVALTAISLGMKVWVYTDGVANGSFSMVTIDQP